MKYSTITSFRCSVFLFLWLASSCATQRKLELVRQGSADAHLSLLQEERTLAFNHTEDPKAQDTIRVKDLSGKEVFLMRAVQDEDGEMIASEVLEPAVITATFRNVAERLGVVDLQFCIHVPASLQDPNWQIRFYPKLCVQNDTLILDPVLVTGTDYRQRQLRGYEAYEEFLRSIITDSSQLRYQALIAHFLDRNKNNLQDLRWEEILRYYERRGLIFYNNLKIKNLDNYFQYKVKAPYLNCPIYLDTPATDSTTTHAYQYTLRTRPRLRKADLYLTGEIWKDGSLLYAMPQSDPLTFYISSLATLQEDRTRYVQRIVERKALTKTMAYIDFAQGSARIDTCLHENASELARIENNIVELLSNKTFLIDSLVITSTCSPEGRYSLNQRLAHERGKSLQQHFQQFVNDQMAKWEEEQKQTLYLDWTVNDSLQTPTASPILPPARDSLPAFSFINHTIPEDWDRLKVLVQHDSLLQQREELLQIINAPLAPDLKENQLRRQQDFGRLYRVLFPLMRTVRFDFHLHRRGMVKDTLHTTEIDTLYEAGKAALLERDFEKALTLLRPYQDLNTAVACLCLDYNHTAKSILQTLRPSGKRNYLLALTHARLNERQEALQHLVHCFEMDPSLKFRGNLDPEISQLMQAFNLNEQ